MEEEQSEPLVFLIQSPDPAVKELVEELEAELAQHYAAEQRHGLDFDALFQPNIRFYAAKTGQTYVGCGGIALFDDYAELKRMYVRVSQRGTETASKIIATLESEARSNGITTVRLETGTQQVAAIRFYQKHGYTPCAAFGQYLLMKPESIATSLFFEKNLA